MSRLAARFEELAKTGRKALIPFITAGDPRPDFTVPMMHAMVKAGVDVIAARNFATTDTDIQLLSL